MECLQLHLQKSFSYRSKNLNSESNSGETQPPKQSKKVKNSFMTNKA